jgi:hypothetical protein
MIFPTKKKVSQEKSNRSPSHLLQKNAGHPGVDEKHDGAGHNELRVDGMNFGKRCPGIEAKEQHDGHKDLHADGQVMDPVGIHVPQSQCGRNVAPVNQDEQPHVNGIDHPFENDARFFCAHDINEEEENIMDIKTDYISTWSRGFFKQQQIFRRIDDYHDEYCFEIRNI